MSTPRSRLIRRVLVGLVLALAATSCATDVVKDYGAQAKLNFVNGCTTERKVANGKVIVTELAPKQTCECIYGQLSKKVGQLDFSDLTDYEAKVSAAKAGDAPAMPHKLKVAISTCQARSVTGPKLATSTTTTTTG